MSRGRVRSGRLRARRACTHGETRRRTERGARTDRRRAVFYLKEEEAGGGLFFGFGALPRRAALQLPPLVSCGMLPVFYRTFAAGFFAGFARVVSCGKIRRKSGTSQKAEGTEIWFLQGSLTKTA